MMLLMIQWHKLVLKTANHDNDNIVHIMNNCEWSEDQKHKLVEIDRQKRRRGKNFMKRVKAR